MKSRARIMTIPTDNFGFSIAEQERVRPEEERRGGLVNFKWYMEPFTSFLCDK